MLIVSRPCRIAERTRTQSVTRSPEGKALTTRFDTRSRARCSANLNAPYRPLRAVAGRPENRAIPWLAGDLLNITAHNVQHFHVGPCGSNKQTSLALPPRLSLRGMRSVKRITRQRVFPKNALSTPKIAPARDSTHRLARAPAAGARISNTSPPDVVPYSIRTLRPSTLKRAKSGSMPF